MVLLYLLLLRTYASFSSVSQPSAEVLQMFDRVLLLRKGGQTVYFGDTGPNASKVVRYFENNGSRRCRSEENPYAVSFNALCSKGLSLMKNRADFMLDVLGAVPATIERDWHEIWKTSKEYRRLQRNIDKIRFKGLRRPDPAVVSHKNFATSWIHQTYQLTKRNFVSYWRNPTYLVFKLAFNVIGGLFVGLTFFKAKDTVQGTQDKVFVSRECLRTLFFSQ
jgi:ATP-binding cassette, subfamily G (WHITE), member 2, SNQ2